MNHEAIKKLQNWPREVENYWNRFCQNLFSQLRPEEGLTLSLSGENTLYVRANNAKIRQNSQVEQLSVSLILKQDQKAATLMYPLTLNEAIDFPAYKEILASARKNLQNLPVDPFFLPLNEGDTSHFSSPSKIDDPLALVETALQLAKGLDFVGFFAFGEKVIATQNSKGLSHWYANHSFFIDYSIYDGPKAAKGVYSGSEFSKEQWQAKLVEAQTHLKSLLLPQVILKPGSFRAYLSPHAVAEIVQLTEWEAWSYQAYRQGSSAFRKWHSEGLQLSPQLEIVENFRLGLNPRFNETGEIAPESIHLVRAGRFENFLTNNRSAKEFSATSNFANAMESPRSLEILPGTLQNSQILATLQTGVYLSQLHYTNWSDRQSAKVTGMTRFACFFVEDGQIVGPIQDMRFDVSLFDIWGAQLESLTQQTEVIPSTLTYEERSSGGLRLPGMLIKNFEFTL